MSNVSANAMSSSDGDQSSGKRHAGRPLARAVPTSILFSSSNSISRGSFSKVDSFSLEGCGETFLFNGPTGGFSAATGAATPLRLVGGGGRGEPTVCGSPCGCPPCPDRPSDGVDGADGADNFSAALSACLRSRSRSRLSTLRSSLAASSASTTATIISAVAPAASNARNAVALMDMRAPRPKTMVQFAARAVGRSATRPTSKFPPLPPNRA